MNTFREPVERAARCFAERVAVVDEDRRITFGELRDRTQRLGTALGALGLQPGDRVAVLADNCLEYLEIYLGAPAAGFAIVPLNSRFALAEHEAIVADCEPVVLFTDRAVDELGVLPRLVRHVVHLGKDYQAFVESADPGWWGPAPAEDAMAVLLYTGGTTGRAKGVMLSHRNKLVDALSVIAGTSLTDADCWLVCSPMYHSSGTFNIVPCVWVGARMVIHPRFEPAAVLDTFEAESITITFAVPTMFAALVDGLAERHRDVSSLRVLGHGAAPITTTQLRRVCAAFPDAEIVGMYGATEMAPMATTFPHEERISDPDLLQSCGYPVIGVDVRVLDDDGIEVPANTVGEVCVRGPNVMLGYWGLPEETAAAVVDGWYHSGDLGLVDDTGLVYIVDRKKDMIISGGENVYSTEVENVLATVQGVREVAVIGLPDERWGEAVSAVVVSERAIDPEDLRTHCRASLAGYKVPKTVVVRSEPLPRTPSGKVLKRQLRAEFSAG